MGYLVELISIAGDRVPLKGENTIPVNFLGAQANLPVGPYLLARALGCPLFSLSSIKVDGIYQLGVQELSKWNSEEKNDPSVDIGCTYCRSCIYRKR
jgi:predicted LPLAT superfamily acyltransferase